MGSPDLQTTSVMADALDAEQLKQLHEATLKVSDSCFELKKLCATVLAPTVTIVTLFTNKRLDAAVFAVGLAIVIAFWLADSVGFYYQRKLRSLMTPIWERRAARCQYVSYPRISKYSWFHSAFNQSMTYYLILGSLILGALLAFRLGWVNSYDLSGSS